MLASAGILGFLYHDHLILIHLLGQGEGGCQCCVSGRSFFHPFQTCQDLSHPEHIPLLDGEVTVHVAQRSGCGTWHVRTVRPGGEGNAEAGVSCGEAFTIELGIGSHMQAGQVYRSSHHLSFGCSSLDQASSGTG